MKKLALALVIIAAIGYVGYRVQRAGGFEEFFRELREAPAPSPVATATPTPTSTLTPSPSVSVSPTPTTAVTAVLATMNARRADAGIGALAINGILAREAQEHAADMAARSYFSHTTPEGVTFQQRMSGSGYPSGTLAENIGLTNGGSAEDVVAIWMDSPPHRANLLNHTLIAVGVGVANGTYQGRPAIYVVAIFGDVK